MDEKWIRLFKNGILVALLIFSGVYYWLTRDWWTLAVGWSSFVLASADGFLLGYFLEKIREN